jgi:RNA polymerase-interacting CarD/CdnL/TRCF family regulator
MNEKNNYSPETEAKAEKKFDVAKINSGVKLRRSMARTDAENQPPSDEAKRIIDQINTRLDYELKTLEQFRGREETALFQTELAYIESEIDRLCFQLDEAHTPNKFYKFLLKLENKVSRFLTRNER